jgi:hypothetical protein
MRARLTPSFETPLRGSSRMRAMVVVGTASIFILRCGKKIAHSELPGSF